MSIWEEDNCICCGGGRLMFTLEIVSRENCYFPPTVGTQLKICFDCLALEEVKKLRRDAVRFRQLKQWIRE